MKKVMAILIGVCLLFGFSFSVFAFEGASLENFSLEEVSLMVSCDKNGRCDYFKEEEAREKLEGYKQEIGKVLYKGPCNYQEERGIRCHQIVKKVLFCPYGNTIENHGLYALRASGVKAYEAGAEIPNMLSLSALEYGLNFKEKLLPNAKLEGAFVLNVAPQAKGELFVLLPYYELSGEKLDFVNGGGGAERRLPFTLKVPIESEMAFFYRETRL